MRERLCDPVAVPGDLVQDVVGYQWSCDTTGESGAAIYRLDAKAGAPDLYLKHGVGKVADAIVDEMVRLRWLGEHISVPAIVRFACTPDDAWMLTTALPGRTAYDLIAADGAQAAGIVDALARFLRRLHAVPVAICPFVADQSYRLEQARARIDAGLVDEDDFDDERLGWSAERVWGELQAMLPFDADRVVTHGDFSLDNVLLSDGEVTGCIDVGRAGVADRYQDIAILWNCLGEFDEELRHRFLRAYGLDIIDEDKLRFHLMLDELF